MSRAPQNSIKIIYFRLFLIVHRFVTSSALRVHVRGVHMHVNRHICDICAKIYNSKTCYDQHRLTEHSEMKWTKLQCKICQSWYARY